MSKGSRERALSAIWREELLRLAALLSLSVILGLFAGHIALFLGIGIGIYAAWQLRQTFRLVRWLQSSGEEDVPEAGGMWGEVFGQIYRHQQRNHRDKRQLAAIIDEFQASTAALPDAVVVIDPAGCISWCNEAAKVLLGLDMPHDIGYRIANLLRNPVFVEYYKSGQYSEEIALHSPEDDERILSLRLVPYGEGQMLLLARDISQLHQMERIRRDFVANASHELRTPLTVIRGYLDMMEEESADTRPLKPWQGPLAEMRQQAARMGRIIEDLLKLARIESASGKSRQEVVDIPQMINLIMDEARALSEGKHRLHTDIEESLLLYGQAGELQSVVGNLVFNAVQYTPEGGEIHVRWHSDARGAHYSVTDTGIGVEVRHIPRLTERFYRVDAGRSRATGGTGLGLAIVKHALEHHEGQLEIASELNVGSTFSCHFPARRIRPRVAAA